MIEELATLGLFILIGGAIWIAGSLLAKSGWLHVPLEMKVIYRSTREWLGKAGWGGEQHEDPNPPEDS